MLLLSALATAALLFRKGNIYVSFFAVILGIEMQRGLYTWFSVLKTVSRVCKRNRINVNIISNSVYTILSVSRVINL